MKLIINDSRKPLLAICYHQQMNLLMSGLHSVQSSCWLKVFNRNHETTQAIVKTISRSPQTDREIPFLKKKLIQPIDVVRFCL